MIGSRGYRADCIFTLPYAAADHALFEKAFRSADLEMPPHAQAFLEEMNFRFSYECELEVCRRTEMSCIGELMLECSSDSDMHESESASFSTYAFLSASFETDMAVLMLYCPDTAMPLHFIHEEFSRGNARFGEVTLDSYMRQSFGLERCGRVRNLIALDREPDDDLEMLYFLSTEEYGTMEIDSALKGDYRELFPDISQYENSEIRCGDNTAVMILESFSDDVRERLYDETLVLQIIEYLEFKMIAIERTNRRVVAELEDDGDASMEDIKKLTTQFARTIPFWDTSNFVYPSTRRLAAGIRDSFNPDGLMNRYNRNMEMLEHIISIRSASAAEEEARILSIIGLALTVLQCVPILYSLVCYLAEGSFRMTDLMYGISAVSGTGMLCLICFALIRLRGRRRKKN